MGRFKIGTIGLGRSQVNGLSRVPEPPAISTARIDSAPLSEYNTLIKIKEFKDSLDRYSLFYHAVAFVVT